MKARTRKSNTADLAARFIKEERDIDSIISTAMRQTEWLLNPFSLHVDRYPDRSVGSNPLKTALGED